MQLTGFNGVLFSAVNVTAHLQEIASPGPERSVSTIPRVAANPYAVGVSQGATTITAVFSVATGQVVQTTLMKLLAVLNPDDPEPQTLTGTLVAGTAVETTAYVGRWSYPTSIKLAVEFVVITPGWRATTTTTLKTLAGDVVNGSFANGNTGYREVLPTVTTYWPSTTQRSSTTATFGWKHKIPYVVTNVGIEPIINEPWQIGPIDTAAWVTASQMQADGDDLRVFSEGQELRRNVIGANTKATLVWIILPDMMPGQVLNLEIVTNNPSATSPPTLSYTTSPQLPAMDIGGTSFTPTAVSSTNVTLSGANWEDSQWEGATLIVAGASGANKQMRFISNSTATVLTPSVAFNPTPALSDTIVVTRSGIEGYGGIATGGTTSTLVVSGSVSAGLGMQIEITGGTGVGQIRTISAVSGSTYTVTPNWATAPTATSTYRIYQGNRLRVWDIRTVPKATPHKGLWMTNKSQAPPSIVSFDAPASWYRFTYQRNQDAYSQPRFDSFLVGAGDYDHFPVLRLRRARRGKAGVQTEVGVADSVGYATPFTILYMAIDCTFRNATKSGIPGEGLAEMRVMVQEAGGELWTTAYSNLTEYNTTTSIGPSGLDVTGFGSPNRVAVTLIPNAADEIDEADNNTAELRSISDIAIVKVDPTGSITESVNFFAATPALTACYDMHLLIRTGGASAVKPYAQLVIGGPGRRIFVGGTNERIVVDCETHTATLVTAAGVLVRRIPYAVTAEDVVADPDGVTQTLVAASWLPIPSTTLDASAIYFTDPSGAGWGSINIGVTGQLGYHT